MRVSCVLFREFLVLCCQIGKVEESAGVENTFQKDHTSHTFKFEDTVILSNYYPRLYGEVINTKITSTRKMKVHKSTEYGILIQDQHAKRTDRSTEPQVISVSELSRLYVPIDTASFLVV